MAGVARSTGVAGIAGAAGCTGVAGIARAAMARGVGAAGAMSAGSARVARVFGSTRVARIARVAGIARVARITMAAGGTRVARIAGAAMTRGVRAAGAMSAALVARVSGSTRVAWITMAWITRTAGSTRVAGIVRAAMARGARPTRAGNARVAATVEADKATSVARRTAAVDLVTVALVMRQALGAGRRDGEGTVGAERVVAQAALVVRVAAGAVGIGLAAAGVELGVADLGALVAVLAADGNDDSGVVALAIGVVVVLAGGVVVDTFLGWDVGAVRAKGTETDAGRVLGGTRRLVGIGLAAAGSPLSSAGQGALTRLDFTFLALVVGLGRDARLVVALAAGGRCLERLLLIRVVAQASGVLGGARRAVGVRLAETGVVGRVAGLGTVVDDDRGGEGKAHESGGGVRVLHLESSLLVKE